MPWGIINNPHQPGPSRGQPAAMVEANVTADSPVLTGEEAVPVHLLDGGELVLLTIKPSMWYIVFRSFRTLLAVAMVIALSYPLSHALDPLGLSQRLLVRIAIGVAGVRLLIATLQWVSRLYVLTNRRIMRIRGIFNVDIFECQLTRIQNLFLRFAIYERIFGLGTIGFATAGTGGVEASWENINYPLEVHERVRAAISKARGDDGEDAI